MIAIAFALPAESSAFLRLVREKTIQNQNGIKTIRGKIDNRAIEVLHTGVGEKACRKTVASFLQERQLDCLISAGFAGALSDELRAGDLILAKNFSGEGFTRAQSALATFSLHVADMHTVEKMIDSIAERNAIRRQTGAVAIDMETKFIAQACSDRGLPIISLRVVSDTPAEPFPAPPGILFDVASQRTDMITLAAYLLTHPPRIPGLIRFARRIERAKRVLAEALVEVVGSMV